MMPQKLRVLVVEDDSSVRTALAELLQIWGYQPETASDGVEALMKIRSSPPTAVISDLQLPRMGGVELLEALHTSGPSVACIVVTGGASVETAALAHALGALDYLEKPVDVQRLRQDLRRCSQKGDSSGLYLAG